MEKSETFDTVLDYVRWRGDLTLDVAPFNDLDAAVFTQFCLLEIGEFLTGKTKALSIEKLYKKYEKVFDIDSNIGLIISNKTKYLFREMKNTKRYKDLVVSDYVYDANGEEGKQFCALTVRLSEKEKLVVFSGTDDTVVGWMENFSMIVKPFVPAAEKAVEYLKTVSSDVEHVIVCGHSKGGGLTMYSLFFSSESVAKKIERAIAFDGPGLVFQKPDKIAMARKEKLIEYAPYHSLIGRLFSHYGKTVVTESSFNGSFQHDLFSWRVERDAFTALPAFSDMSDKVDKGMKEILDELSQEERERMLKTAFSVLERTGANTLTELNNDLLSLVKSYFTEPIADRVFLYRVFLGKLFSIKEARRILFGDVFDKNASAVIVNSKKNPRLNTQE